jgi:hypothetical protein
VLKVQYCTQKLILLRASSHVQVWDNWPGCGNKPWTVGALWGRVKTQTDRAGRCGNFWGSWEEKSEGGNFPVWTGKLALPLYYDTQGLLVRIPSTRPTMSLQKSRHGTWKCSQATFLCPLTRTFSHPSVTFISAVWGQFAAHLVLYKISPSLYPFTFQSWYTGRWNLSS